MSHLNFLSGHADQTDAARWKLVHQVTKFSSEFSKIDQGEIYTIVIGGPYTGMIIQEHVSSPAMTTLQRIFSAVYITTIFLE